MHGNRNGILDRPPVCAGSEDRVITDLGAKIHGKMDVRDATIRCTNRLAASSTRD